MEACRELLWVKKLMEDFGIQEESLKNQPIELKELRPVTGLFKTVAGAAMETLRGPLFSVSVPSVPSMYPHFCTPRGLGK